MTNTWGEKCVKKMIVSSSSFACCACCDLKFKLSIVETHERHKKWPFPHSTFVGICFFISLRILRNVHECVVCNAIDFGNRLHLPENKSTTWLTLIFNANEAEPSVIFICFDRKQMTWKMFSFCSVGNEMSGMLGCVLWLVRIDVIYEKSSMADW